MGAITQLDVILCLYCQLEYINFNFLNKIYLQILHSVHDNNLRISTNIKFKKIVKTNKKFIVWYSLHPQNHKFTLLCIIVINNNSL